VSGTKVCTKCGVEKSVEDFSRRSNRPSGRASACKVCDSARGRKRAKENPERHRENARRWRERNPGRAAEHQVAWVERNYDQHLAVARYRAHERRAQVRNPDEDTRTYMVIAEGDPCAYCGGPGGSLDHISSLVDGGQHDWTNLTGACQRCNKSKGAKPLLEYLLYRSR
jgi:5-methylcytosine-specific restriction endonuclease McrA